MKYEWKPTLGGQQQRESGLELRQERCEGQRRACWRSHRARRPRGETGVRQGLISPTDSSTAASAA